MTEHAVADVEDVPPGESIGVTVDGLGIAVFNVDGRFYAMQNACQHKDGPMYRAHVDADSCSVYCPWHWWEWDLETGRSPVDPNKRMRIFDVEVVDGEVRVTV